MKKTRFTTILILLLLVFLSSTVYAHSGGTDAQGGHNSPDGYHYHHGYPAHQHENGECPYDFVDKSGESSGSSSGSSRTYPQYTPRPTVFEPLPEGEPQASTAREETDPLFVVTMVIMGAAIVAAVVAIYVLKRSAALTDELNKKKLEYKEEK